MDGGAASDGRAFGISFVGGRSRGSCGGRTYRSAHRSRGRAAQEPRQEHGRRVFLFPRSVAAADTTTTTTVAADSSVRSSRRQYGRQPWCGKEARAKAVITTTTTTTIAAATNSPHANHPDLRHATASAATAAISATRYPDGRYCQASVLVPWRWRVPLNRRYGVRGLLQELIQSGDRPGPNRGRKERSQPRAQAQKVRDAFTPPSLYHPRPRRRPYLRHRYRAPRPRPISASRATKCVLRSPARATTATDAGTATTTTTTTTTTTASGGVQPHTGSVKPQDGSCYRTS